MLSREIAEQMVARLPHGKLVEIEESGHQLPQHQPEAFSAVVRSTSENAVPTGLPTGLPGTAPPGPAIPVIATATLARERRSAPRAISRATGSLTAP